MSQGGRSLQAIMFIPFEEGFSTSLLLGGGFKYFLFSPVFEEMIQFD